MSNSFIYSIQSSGTMGQLILLILLGLSIISWTIIVSKIILFKKMKDSDALFINSYDQMGYESIYNEGTKDIHANSPAYIICRNSCDRISAEAENRQEIQKDFAEEISLVIKEELTAEMDRINNLTFLLATISSIAPFFGLLGTVWGIMTAFRGMGMVGAASIGTVAPGIAEALITTVAGLIVAIPALIGYNYFMNENEKLSGRLQNFCARLFNEIKQNI